MISTRFSAHDCRWAAVHSVLPAGTVYVAWKCQLNCIIGWCYSGDMDPHCQVQFAREHRVLLYQVMSTWTKGDMFICMWSWHDNVYTLYYTVRRLQSSVRLASTGKVTYLTFSQCLLLSPLAQVGRVEGSHVYTFSKGLSSYSVGVCHGGLCLEIMFVWDQATHTCATKTIRIHCHFLGSCTTLVCWWPKWETGVN